MTANRDDFKRDILLIAFAGLPSSGKSSTAKMLAQLMEVPVFVEPEEKEWPDLIRTREITGKFTALTWFRGARLPGLFKAKLICDEGKTVVVDSYYDKLVSLYMKEPCFSWLLPTDDPYFDVAYDMASLDYAILPNADFIVFLKLDRDTWLRFMQTRGREFDRSADLELYFEMQHHMELACQSAAREHNMRLIVINQQWSSPANTALVILEKLKHAQFAR